MKSLYKIYFVSILSMILMLSLTSSVAGKQPKAKFYDFSEQLIDGERKKPTNLYIDAREAVKFKRLLKLKKSFLPKLFNTAKERTFK